MEREENQTSLTESLSSQNRQLRNKLIISCQIHQKRIVYSLVLVDQTINVCPILYHVTSFYVNPMDVLLNGLSIWAF